MEIDFLIIADAVEAVNGKLYMLGGGWNLWRSPSYPTQVRMGIAMGILVQWDETNRKYPVRISIADGDGQPVIPEITADFEVGRPPGLPAGTAQRALLAINASFPLQRAGRYAVRLAVDNVLERSVMFDAILVSAPSIEIR